MKSAPACWQVSLKDCFVPRNEGRVAHAVTFLCCRHEVSDCSVYRYCAALQFCAFFIDNQLFVAALCCNLLPVSAQFCSEIAAVFLPMFGGAATSCDSTAAGFYDISKTTG